MTHIQNIIYFYLKMSQHNPFTILIQNNSENMQMMYNLNLNEF